MTKDPSLDIRTKIIISVGPSLQDKEKLRKVVRTGVRLFRINASHGNSQHWDLFYRWIRELEKEEKHPLALMIDIQGPKLRIAVLDDPIALKKGSLCVLGHFKKAILGKVVRIPVDFKGLHSCVKKGTHIFLDDGKLELEVISIKPEAVQCRVIFGGLLESRKGMNIPYHQGKVTLLGPKDRSDLLWAIGKKIEFIAISFVRQAADVVQYRQFIQKQSKAYQPQLIAKIEKPEAVEDLEAIAQVSDGLMVARGDLGIELSLEKLPVVQKRIIEICREAKKPVIVATQMLDSMRQYPRPTRAEVSDVAGAIYGGADAVLLTGETSSGNYPIETCQMMYKIIHETEAHLIEKMFRKTPEDFGVKNFLENFLYEVMQLSTSPDIGAIVVLTRQGHMPRILSKMHPRRRIFSLALNTTTWRQLNLLWGIYPLALKKGTIASLFPQVMRQLKKILGPHDKSPSKKIIFLFPGNTPEEMNLRIVKFQP